MFFLGQSPTSFFGEKILRFTGVIWCLTSEVWKYFVTFKNQGEDVRQQKNPNGRLGRFGQGGFFLREGVFLVGECDKIRCPFQERCCKMV